MCGIVGVIGEISGEEALATAQKMNQTLIHRGPDDQGSWAQDGFGFAMRRLSIIDLNAGHQPMFAADGVGIVFNGEIYNFQQLRASLTKKGVSFKSHSDTEVVLELYRDRGLSGISDLGGMFSICIWDPRIKAIHLIRDRLGIKPLYVGEAGNRLYFGSEIKALLTVMTPRPEILSSSIFHYLTLRYVPAPQTIWNSIKKVDPGTCLTVHLPSLRQDSNRYWKLNFQSEREDSARDYLGEFEKLFKESVESQIIASDVPVGVLLSGGLDSSAIAATARELGHQNFHSFNVYFSEGGAFSERRYAQEVALHVGSNHHEIEIGERQFMEFLPTMVQHLEEPLADLASIPLFFLCALARKHVKVVLSGEGSDEVLAGYRFDRIARILNLHARWVNVLPRSVREMNSTFRKYLDTNSLLSTRPFHLSYYWDSKEKESLFKDQVPVATESLIESWYHQTSSSNPLDQLQQAHCHSWLVEDLLMKADKMSMANSLELRVPFLDHRLVEWAAKAPLGFKVGDPRSGFASKKILRDYCMTRLPDSILSRPKQGFPVPAYRWLEGETGAWAESMLLSPSNRVSEWLNVSKIRPVLTRARRGHDRSAHKIWALIVLEHWLKQWDS